MSDARTMYLVRHAATGIEGAFIGRRDVPLSDEGNRQAERLAVALADVGADVVFSSDLLRAQQTALPIAARFGLTPTLLTGLRERDFGEWEGLAWEQVVDCFPSDADAYVRRWPDVVPTGGEAVDAMRDRVRAAWAEIASADWTRAIVVGHGGTNRLLLAEFLGMPLTHLFRIGQEVAAVNRITIVEDVPCVTEINRRFDHSRPGT